MTRLASMRRRVLRAVTDDSGIAMITVIGIVTILFVLSTMVLGVAIYQISAETNQESRTIAVHVADAGLNAYLYELRRDRQYWSTHPTAGPTPSGNGYWTVQAIPPSGTVPLTLRATGYLPSKNMTRTVVAAVRFPTFADFVFLSDTDINIGADAVITGKMHSNGDINNSGIVTGRVSAHGSVTGLRDIAHLQSGYDQNVPSIDFSTVTTDLSVLRTVATASGDYFAASGSSGYRVTLNTTRYKVEKVTGGTGTGNLTTTLVRDWTNIPSNGVLYFLDSVWVQGNYAAMITIGSSNTIYIPDNLAPSNADTQFTCGLIATNDIIVPTWYPSLPTNMTVTAALLAQNGAVYGDLQSGKLKNHIEINGSMAYSNYGYFASYSGSTVVAGFKSRDYNYDPRLDLYPPPQYPAIKDGTLKVTSWIEQ